MTIRDLLPATIKTRRLILRRPELADLSDIVALLANWNVVATTAAIPFPYEQRDGQQFLTTLDQPELPRNYAIADADNRLMGIIGLKCAAGQPPELGYWLGEPFWGQGLVSEASEGLLAAVDATAQVPELRARVLAGNRASLRVLQKSGFVIIEHTTSTLERHLGQTVIILRRVTP